LRGQYFCRLLTHYPRSACNLCNGFTLDPEGGEKCADLGIGGPALHYFGHAFRHLGLGKADILNYKVTCFFYQRLTTRPFAVWLVLTACFFLPPRLYEIPEKILACCSKYRFGMELYPFDKKFLVSHSH